ncbi:MAG: GWxTD domain-containing protein [Candidatus Aminicenantes bacterium]|nr:GWxTD domain-containing protein [Candidatus Aminicenantes bacterium]
MKRTLWLPVVLILVLLLPAVSERALIKQLSPRYKTWLTEEVVYIIAEKEKEVFLQLSSDLERDAFIKAFWKQRDPNPNTPENEFMIEHHRRIQYANQWFGKESPAPGWKSDMGRIYILLGAPKSVDKLENTTELRPIVIWYYQGMADMGLPNAFDVLFFKRDFSGDFELYSPVRFGPQYLMMDYDGDINDYQTAYAKLLEIEPTVAELSLNLIPGESSGYSPSMSSELLITTKIPTAPARKVNTQYAEKMLRYKDMVEMDYTANYIESSKVLTVVRHPAAGNYFVHYLIEPKKLTIEQYNDKFYTTLEIFGSIIDNQNRSVFQFNKSIPVELNETQMVNIKDKLFSFQDMFPLIPGKYKITILLKNTVSREFTSAEGDVEIPESPPTGISSLLLANRLIDTPSYNGQSKPFLIDNRQLVPSPRNDFLASDTLVVFFQLLGLSSEVKGEGSLQFDIIKDNASVQTVVKKIADYSGALPDVIEKLPLAAFKAANYTLRVTLLSPQGKPLDVKESLFYITPMPALPQPWVMSLPQPSITAPQYWNDLGNQYLNLKNLAQARPLLERAYHLSPINTAFAMDFCRVLVEQKDFQQAKDIALLPYKNQGKNQFLLMLAQTSQALNQYTDAIDYFVLHINHYGGSPKILNALADCYLALGNNPEAIQAWEKSLKIDPKQDKIKERLAALRGDKK